MPDLPRKLKDDAIVEALLEVRFETSESVREILVGRLSEQEPWAAFENARLAVADIPLPIRLADAALRYQPFVEKRERGGVRVVKLGTNVLSFHIVRTYCGWTQLQPQLNHAVDVLAAKVPDFKATRLGLRYINALTPAKHYVTGLADLFLEVAVANAKLTVPFNLNFIRSIEKDLSATTRLAHPFFVEGKLPEGASAYVDVDVATPIGFQSSDANQIKGWIERAHTAEKTAFFGLLTPETIEKLKEE